MKWLIVILVVVMVVMGEMVLVVELVEMVGMVVTDHLDAAFVKDKMVVAVALVVLAMTVMMADVVGMRCTKSRV